MELDSRGQGVTGTSRLAGDQLTIVRETRLPGEIPDSGFERVVAAIQSSSHEHGQPSLLGRTLTWQAETASKTRSILLAVSARNGETRIRVEERLHQFAGGLFGGIMGGVGGGVGIGAGVPLAQFLGSVTLGFAIPLGVLGLSYLGAREIYRAVANHRRKAIDALMELVTSEVQDAISSAAAEAGPEQKALPG